MEKFSKKIKKINKGIYITIAILFIVTLVLLWLVNRSTLILSITPTDCVVTLDNKVIFIDSNGNARTVNTPGTYLLRVEKDGYIANISEINLKKARTQKVEISLEKAPKPYTISEISESGQEVAQNVQFISEADDFNSILYFADNASTLYNAKFKINDKGETETVYNRNISNPPLSGIKDIIWSPKKDAAIFKKDDGAYFFDFKKYNFVSQEEIKYGEHIGDIAWSPDDSKIAYYYAPGSGEKSLIFANKTNSEMTRVADFVELGINNPYLCWSPDSEWLIVIPRNSDINQNKIYLFNAYTRSFKQITDTGNNLEAKFSPNGERIIYSSVSDDPNHPIKSIVSVMNKNGENKKSLDLRAHIGKISWFHNSKDKIVVATFDTEKKQESIFGFNIDKKEKDSFTLTLPKNEYISEISLSNENNFLFYISNQQFYIVRLNKLEK